MNSITRRCAAAASVAALVTAPSIGTGYAMRPAEPSAAKAGTVATGAVSDPNDTDGRLDIARVSDRTVEVRRNRYFVSYRVRTEAAFPSERLDAKHRNFALELNRDDERGSERNVRIAARDGQLVAEVISTATRDVIATVTASRPNDQTLEISGPRHLIGARSYFWTSNFHARYTFADGTMACRSCAKTTSRTGWLRMQRPAWPGGRRRPPSGLKHLGSRGRPVRPVSAAPAAIRAFSASRLSSNRWPARRARRGTRQLAAGLLAFVVEALELEHLPEPQHRHHDLVAVLAHVVDAVDRDLDRLALEARECRHRASGTSSPPW